MTKVISLSEDAYPRLKRRKGEGESFSDVVVRLTGDDQDTSLLALKGPGREVIWTRSAGRWQ